MRDDKVDAVYFFVDEDGACPVKDYLNALPKRERARALAYISELKVQGYNLPRPLAGYLRDGIHELRPNDNRIFYFFYLKNNVVLVHAIAKHVDRVPEADIDLSVKRKKGVEKAIYQISKMEGSIEDEKS